MSVRLFLSELKRRQVYRAVLVYATVAWVLLEGADIVFPRLGFNEGSVTLVLVLAVVGFPIAVYLAWVYDITPDGIYRTPPLSAGARHPFSWARIAEFVVIGTLVTVVGYLYLDRLSLQERLAQQESTATYSPDKAPAQAVNPEKVRAIAVLPFADMSEGGDQAWFAEGIAEELLHALASVRGLKITARTSSFAFKDTSKTVAEIAEILGVQAVLEGSVRRFGDRVRVSAQLIDANSGYHLWSEAYERQIVDIFKLQDELARSIVKALQLELDIEQAGVLVQEQTRDPEAYGAFMRGRTIDIASPQALYESISFLEKAVAVDPGYAKAWGHLSLARAWMALWRSTAEVSAPAAAAYEKALALDPEQSEALTAKAFLTQLTERDWETAGELYQRALVTKDSSYPMSMFSVFFLAPIDVLPLAIELLQNAESRDPLFPGIKSNLAMLYIWSGDSQRAILKAKEALQIRPSHVFALMALIEALTATGDCAAVYDVVGNLPATLQKEPRISGRLAVCLQLDGREEEAREIFRRVLEATPHYHANLQAAVLAIRLGEVEKALDVMESEVGKHSWPTIFIRTYYRQNDAVNEHPRYLALLERVGLDDESVTELRATFAADH